MTMRLNCPGAAVSIEENMPAAFLSTRQLLEELILRARGFPQHDRAVRTLVRGFAHSALVGLSGDTLAYRRAVPARKADES